MTLNGALAPHLGSGWMGEAKRGRSGRSLLCLWGGGISPGSRPCPMPWAKLLGPWGPGTISIPDCTGYGHR